MDCVPLRQFGTGWHCEPRARIPPGGGSAGPFARSIASSSVRLASSVAAAAPPGAAPTSTCGGAAATAVSMSTGLTGITMSTPRSS